MCRRSPPTRPGYLADAGHAPAICRVRPLARRKILTGIILDPAIGGPVALMTALMALTGTARRCPPPSRETCAAAFL